MLDFIKCLHEVHSSIGKGVSGTPFDKWTAPFDKWTAPFDKWTAPFDKWTTLLTNGPTF